MSMAIRASAAESIEALAGRVGSYIPLSAGMGGSYMSGGAMRADPARFAAPGFPGVRSPLPRQDVYIPSIPAFEAGQTGAPIYEKAPNNGQNEYIDTYESTIIPGQTEPEEADPPIPATGETAGYAGPEEPPAATDTQGDAEDPDVNVPGNAAENRAEPENGELTPEQQQIVDELEVRDAEVRAHEQAHVSVGGAYVRGGASYEYESGPDRKRYAVGGEVHIDASPVHDNPEATIQKMQVVRAAALAPAGPSGQDRAVAASAARAEGEARAELSEKRAAEAKGGGENSAQGSAGNNTNMQNTANNEKTRQSRIMNNAVSSYAGNNPYAQAAMPAINFAA
ncbi:MAG: hypothetical protein FWB85_00885 [Chitinispirillia bacterium]|nr:hypothetical protein [Chitinispirillia bacterium]MCL2241057.1 hypothetical protein [Chitinispirillia bacterium]